MSNYTLSAQDVAILREVVRHYRAHKGDLQPSPPRWFPPIGTSAPRRAYCKAASGTGSTVEAYLDTDLTGQLVTVHCDLYLAGAGTMPTNLSECTPILAVGSPIWVKLDGELWRCLMPFIGVEACDES